MCVCVCVCVYIPEALEAIAFSAISTGILDVSIHTYLSKGNDAGKREFSSIASQLS